MNSSEAVNQLLRIYSASATVSIEESCVDTATVACFWDQFPKPPSQISLVSECGKSQGQDSK